MKFYMLHSTKEKHSIPNSMIKSLYDKSLLALDIYQETVHAECSTHYEQKPRKSSAVK